MAGGSRRDGWGPSPALRGGASPTTRRLWWVSVGMYVVTLGVSFGRPDCQVDMAVGRANRNSTRSGVLSLPRTMIHFSRAPIALRAVSLAVTLSVATAGSGLPMCISPLAQAVAPCDMHSGHNGAATPEHRAHRAALVAQGSGQACHQDAAGLGCAAGSTCSSGGPATLAWAKVWVALRAASLTGVLGPDSAFVSYLAPPLSPPPQA
jgi:hypothetical protein